MKKFLAVLLTIVMAVSLTACSGNSNKGTQPGVYSLVEMTVGDEKFDKNEIALYGAGDVYSMEIKDDGTGSLKFQGITTDITWTEGEMLSEGVSIPYEVKGKKITITVEGIKLVFELTK